MNASHTTKTLKSIVLAGLAAGLLTEVGLAQQMGNYTNQPMQTHSGASTGNRSSLGRAWDSTDFNVGVCVGAELGNRGGAVCVTTDRDKPIDSSVSYGPVSVSPADGTTCIGRRVQTPFGGVSGQVCVDPQQRVTGSVGFPIGIGATGNGVYVESQYSATFDPNRYQNANQSEMQPPMNQSPRSDYSDPNGPLLNELRQQAFATAAQDNSNYQSGTEYTEYTAAPNNAATEGMAQEQFRASVDEQMQNFRQAVEYNRQNPLTIDTPNRSQPTTITYDENAPKPARTDANVEYAPRDNRSYSTDGSSQPIGANDQVGYSYRRDGTEFASENGDSGVRENRSYSTDGSSQPIGRGNGGRTLETPRVAPREVGTRSETAAVNLPF